MKLSQKDGGFSRSLRVYFPLRMLPCKVRNLWSTPIVIDINLSNFITVGLIAVVFLAVLRWGSSALGFKSPV